MELDLLKMPEAKLSAVVKGMEACDTDVVIHSQAVWESILVDKLAKLAQPGFCRFSAQMWASDLADFNRLSEADVSAWPQPCLVVARMSPSEFEEIFHRIR